jgi:hypothetical protein
MTATNNDHARNSQAQKLNEPSLEPGQTSPEKFSHLTDGRVRFHPPSPADFRSYEEAKPGTGVTLVQASINDLQAGRDLERLAIKMAFYIWLLSTAGAVAAFLFSQPWLGSALASSGVWAAARFLPNGFPKLPVRTLIPWPRGAP